MVDTSLQITRQIAHKAVENTHHLDTSREKGRAHLDDPPQDLTFDDIIDVLNPLQHLPIVSVIYRALTGDQIKPAMRILGDIGYGGPMGFMSSCAQVLFEAMFGDDIGGTAIALLTGGDDDKKSAKIASATVDPSAQVASTDPSAPEPALADATVAYATFTKARGANR